MCPRRLAPVVRLLNSDWLRRGLIVNRESPSAVSTQDAITDVLSILKKTGGLVSIA